MSEPGHNNPPDMTETAQSTAGDLSAWMSEHPVIAGEDEAREAKVFIDRAKLCIADLEDERKAKTGPLNEQVKAINDHYRQPRELIGRMLDELSNRVSAFILKEEAARIAIAEAARLKAEDAERLAREAEVREANAYKEASQGALDVDLASESAEADARFRDFERAAHQAAIAEREAHVKIGGGFKRSLSLRQTETLYVYNAEAAVAALGATDDIVAAILKSARAFRKLHNKLPTGVSADIERKV